MKNSILFKFVAIILCAVSLMGIIASAAGALVLAEGDLYNRTVEQMVEESLENSAVQFAEETALAYASRELGGCPEGLIRWRYYNRALDCDCGYAILDPEGNVLESLKPELKNTAKTLTFPVSGQYMHLVSAETDSQARAREVQQRMNLLGRGLETADGTVIPPEGIGIHQVYFTDAQGRVIYEAYSSDGQVRSFYYDPAGNTTEGFEHPPQDRIGFLFSGASGQLLYHSFLEENTDAFPDTVVCGVMFVGYDQEFVFTAQNDQGLGMLLRENGCLQFAAYPTEETAAETVPETVPETVTETVPETLPEETSPQETEAAEDAENSEDTQEQESSEDSEHAEDSGYSEDHGDSEDAEDSEEEEDTSEAEDESSSASDEPEEASEEEASEEEASEEEESEEAEQEEESAPAETQPPETLPPETLPQETVLEETVPQETEPAGTEPLLINGKPLEFYQVNRTEYQDPATGQHTTAKYIYLPMPEMTVEVYLNQDGMDNAQMYNLLSIIRHYRGYLLPALGIFLLVFALSVVYLFTVAGRSPKSEEVRAGALNRIPLDLYLGLVLFIGTGAAAFIGFSAAKLLERDFQLGCTTAVSAAFLVCLLAAGFLMAFMAQVKTPGGFWWRNTLCGHCFRGLQKLMQWLICFLQEKGLPCLGSFLKKAWQLCMQFMIWLYRITEKALFWAGNKIRLMFLWIGTKLNRFFSLVPLTWQWVLSGMALFCMILLACSTRNELLTLLCLAASLALIFYGSHCFGNLFKSTKIMGQGNLDTKVNSRLMLGCFREFAGDLNNLADVAADAAQKQLKSERMKTELITNVSHDIKTPLTSIINYVDLLQKPHTEEEGQQYLEVLDRQSQRLKKLVEDLMEMSKASTGNMAVEITKVDAVESVNQALGEFADKLERAHLHPIFNHSEDSVPIMADGKLVWRVLSNLLSNVVKYAMPNTRIYVDLLHVNGKVIISLKNISREELNVDAEELMERFVRGDISRNTEGSGLGLNIAKSLMELQNGHLQILVDGDLFKVTLIFPEA